MKSRFKDYYNSIKSTIAHFGWFTLLLIPIFFFINWAFFSMVNAQRESIETRHSSRATRELNNIDLYINTRLSSVHNDIHVIRDARETNTYLQDPSDANLIEFEDLIYRITSNKPEFVHASIIDQDGQEIYKIHRQADQVIELDSSELEDKSGDPFFDRIGLLNQPQLFVRELMIINDQPILTLIAPLFNQENTIQSYIQIDFDANQFLSVFELYAYGPDDYLSYGLFNNDNVWIIDEENKVFEEVTEEDLANSLKTEVKSDPYAISYQFTVYDDRHHYLIEGEDLFEIYVLIDIESAIDDSQNYMLRFPWMIVLLNLLALGFISYMAAMIRSKNDDRILLNANMYLSAQNKAGVVITDDQLRMTYANQAFLDFYKYTFAELNNKRIKDMIGVERLDDNVLEDIGEDYQDFIWNHTKDYIYILKSLKIRKELTATGKTKHYLGIYSEPEINLDDYSNYIKQKDEILDIITHIFIKEHYVINQTCLMMIKTEQTDTNAFALYLKEHLDRRYMITIPKEHYIIIYANIEKHQFNQAIDMFDQLIESYRHQPQISNQFAYAFVISQSSEQLNNLYDLMGALMIALEYSRHNPQLKHHIYYEEMQLMVQREKDITNQLESGFLKNEFYMLYQVQKDLKNGALLGVEALLRWDNKALGVIPPYEFIPIIENSYYINQLTSMVVKKVIQDFSGYYKDLPKDFRVSINLTHFDFNNDYIMDQLLNIIEDAEIPSSLFTFEITESNYVDNIDKTNRVIDRLHQRNILIAIDDFGTGYSSINALKSIQVDYVKIDKTFIINYPEKDSGEMFKTIASMVRDLNKEIIVEGTETKRQIDYCVSNHCRYAQGYYISKPIKIERMINNFIRTDDGESI